MGYPKGKLFPWDSRRCVAVATRLFVAEILYNLNRYWREWGYSAPSANASGIAIRRGLSRGRESAIIQSSRRGPDSAVIEHVQPFSSGRPFPFAPFSPLPLPRAPHIRRNTMVWPRYDPESISRMLGLTDLWSWKVSRSPTSFGVRIIGEDIMSRRGSMMEEDGRCGRTAEIWGSTHRNREGIDLRHRDAAQLSAE